MIIKIILIAFGVTLVIACAIANIPLGIVIGTLLAMCVMALPDKETHKGD